MRAEGHPQGVPLRYGNTGAEMNPPFQNTTSKLKRRLKMERENNGKTRFFEKKLASGLKKSYIIDYETGSFSHFRIFVPF
jgi:hypothetical protein